MKTRKHDDDGYSEGLDTECAACRLEFGRHNILNVYKQSDPKQDISICENCEELHKAETDITFDADVITDEQFDALKQWAAREWLMVLKPSDMETIDDVSTYIEKQWDAGWSYHHDDSAASIVNNGNHRLFDTVEAKQMDKLRDAAVAICEKAKTDIHEIALKEFRKRNGEPECEGCQKVLDQFDEALKLAGDDTEAAQDAQNKAFNMAEEAGWDWEQVEDGKFASWCLKATDKEILEEGRAKFLAWSKHEPAETPTKFRPERRICGEASKSNAEAARAGDAALAGWQVGNGAKDEADFRDMLADLMHYADREGLDFEEQLSMARNRYEEER